MNTRKCVVFVRWVTIALLSQTQITKYVVPFCDTEYIQIKINRNYHTKIELINQKIENITIEKPKFCPKHNSPVFINRLNSITLLRATQTLPSPLCLFIYVSPLARFGLVVELIGERGRCPFRFFTAMYYVISSPVGTLQVRLYYSIACEIKLILKSTQPIIMESKL